ncbi:TetR/AcrR family transcriptional regulator [Cryobacterium sp. TMT1-3]|uniref:TetR/AcrR family transcriptional regulator n=1 Tax=Cryobacterium luteum TaxID=1424661 RepID=A0A1H8APH6_9MICO|nr:MULTISPECIES: TetR/AcrR family transcriptional regulator [Cryobacterium]TFB88571.1 TetR/AcrR family transcriptional regulator [Cryobacterium luteum]TFC24599.1 TetR/AcrR family transcriptional regulator [Cryobacterium sp. TMT1-3]SEM71874.1 transcriptional regulator, TetR family [Cryobacterium luteum]
MKRIPLTATVIIAEAADLADETGFDDVTLSAIALRLSVQTPSLYSHVRDRAALLDGITALALSELADRVAVAIAGRAGRLALRGFAEAHRVYSLESPGRWQSLQRRAGTAAVESSAARCFVALTDALLLGYDLPPGERVHATRLIGSTINGFLALERIGSFDHSEPPPEVSWRTTLDALDALLRAWPTDTEKIHR